MKEAVFEIVAVLTVLVLTGCASLPKKYIPSRVGYLNKAEAVNNLSVSITAAAEQVAQGKPITFNVAISNTGQLVFWIPREPNILFTWVYSSGRRDNFILDYPGTQHFRKQDAVKLYPGESRETQISIPTGYFPARGITEFQAIYYSPRNTNQALAPFWNGKAFSNAYGINVRKKRYKPR